MITSDIERAVDALNNNDIVAIPTETVYGLAGNAFNETALKKIFDLKKRPYYNPLIVHIKSIDYLPTVAKNIPEIALTLANAFWPGPLTLIFDRQTIVPNLVTGGKDTVAVRIPNHTITLSLLNKLSFPLAAPSANPFGSISPTKAIHVENYFKDDLPIVLEGGDCKNGIESTIIGFNNGKPVLYRHGSISIEQIESVVGKITTHIHNDTAPIAPGMLAKHYAPATSIILVDTIQDVLPKFENKKIGVLVFKDSFVDKRICQIEVLSKTGDLNEAASNLYDAMHRLDKAGLDIIIAERFPNIGLGNSINDRLERATK